MKIKNSLMAWIKRDRGLQIVRRKGKNVVVRRNKRKAGAIGRFKARQG